MRNVSRKLLFATPAFALTLAGTVRLSAAPVLQYSFPASWNGTGTTVTDQSPAGNNGIVSTTAANDPTLSTTQLPAGAAAGTASLVTTTGGIQTSNKQLLSNAIIAAAGGFTYTAKFLWDGTTNSNNVEKVIDYAGTESLQVDSMTAGSAANLHFIFTTQDPTGGSNDITSGPSLPIVPNTWYTATATFNTEGNVVDASGNLAGLATLTLTPDGGSTASASLPETKTTYGDTLNGGRPIGIGELGFTSTTLALVTLHGNIYNPSVATGVTPEPASLALTCLAAPFLLGRRCRRQRV